MKRANNTLSSMTLSDSYKIIENIPKQFLKVSKTTQSIQFTTKSFDRINDRLFECVETIFFISNKFGTWNIIVFLF